MLDSMTILLFDLDGVIIDPRAYKMGVAKTLELLCEKVGLSRAGNLAPTLDEIAHVEACGIHDVWDITNIMFGQILVALGVQINRKKQDIDLAGKSLFQKFAALREVRIQCPRPNYIELADEIAAVEGAPHPPDIARQILSQDLEKIWSQSIAMEWIDILDHFLTGTRSVHKSYGTRIFQNIILGSDEFETTYGLASEYDGPSLLQREDKVLISEASVSLLNKLSERSDHRIAIYTARPSHPPAPETLRSGYSPEAELALDAAKLSHYPLVGMGMMDWLARQHNERGEDLTKPNATQALAAVIAATAKHTDVGILEEAYRIDKCNEDPANTHLGELRGIPTTVWVFEDTSSGIKPMLQAAQRLKDFEYWITVRPLGIAENHSKKTALAKYCERVFASVNDAFEFVLKQTKQE